VIGIAGKDMGKNAFPLVSFAEGFTNYVVKGASIENTGEEYMLGHVQTSHTNAGRPVIQEAKLAEYQKEPTAGREFVTITTPDGPMKPTDLSLWKSEAGRRPNHAWGMMIDLNTCIGCGACVAACPNASAMLFTSAKVSQLALLPQGRPESKQRVLNMISVMDKEGFGLCSNIGACEAECPKGISLENIALMNREYIGASFISRRVPTK
jgi:ferredoxin